MACCRAVIKKASEEEGWPIGWAFDGQKNLFTPERFLPQHEVERVVSTLKTAAPYSKPLSPVESPCELSYSNGCLMHGKGVDQLLPQV